MHRRTIFCESEKIEKIDILIGSLMVNLSIHFMDIILQKLIPGEIIPIVLIFIEMINPVPTSKFHLIYHVPDSYSTTFIEIELYKRRYDFKHIGDIMLSMWI